MLTQECADSIGPHSDQHMITVQLPKKFRVRSICVQCHTLVADSLKALASSYKIDTIQHTTKKKVLSSDLKHGTLPSKALEVLTDEKVSTLERGMPCSQLPLLKPGLNPHCLLEGVQVGGFYDLALLPNYQPELFNLDKDCLVQHNIIDVNEQLVLCHSLYDRLCPGTLVICKASLHGWNIGSWDEKFKRVSLSCSNISKLMKVVLHTQCRHGARFEGGKFPQFRSNSGQV